MNNVIEARKAMVRAYGRMLDAFGEMCENTELLNRIAGSIDDLIRLKINYMMAILDAEAGECPLCGTPQPLTASGVCQHCEEQE